MLKVSFYLINLALLYICCSYFLFGHDIYLGYELGDLVIMIVMFAVQIITGITSFFVGRKRNWLIVLLSINIIAILFFLLNLRYWNW